MKREFRAPIRLRLDPENRKLPRNCSSDPASCRKVSDTRSHCPIVVGGKTSQRSEKPGDLPGRRFFATGSISVRRNPRPRAGEAPSREGSHEQCILHVSLFSPCPAKIGLGLFYFAFDTHHTACHGYHRLWSGFSDESGAAGQSCSEAARAALHNA